MGNEIVSQLLTRDDLFYWKSENRAELEFLIRSPQFVGIDVKTASGSNLSLNSFAILENQATLVIKIGSNPFSYNPNYVAKLPNGPGERSIPFLQLPHYLAGRVMGLLGEK